MTDPGSEVLNWYDPQRPPRPDAVRLADNVYATFAEPWAESVGDEVWPLIWHWCTQSVWAERPDQDPALLVPCWTAAGVRGHDLLSRQPLTLAPSLYYPDCCGLHGFVQDGAWTPA